LVVEPTEVVVDADGLELMPWAAAFFPLKTPYTLERKSPLELFADEGAAVNLEIDLPPPNIVLVPYDKGLLFLASCCN